MVYLVLLESSPYHEKHGHEGTRRGPLGLSSQVIPWEAKVRRNETAVVRQTPLRVYFHALLVGRKILADVWAWKWKLKVHKRALRRLIGDPCPDSGRRAPLKTGPLEGVV